MVNMGALGIDSVEHFNIVVKHADETLPEITTLATAINNRLQIK